MFASCPPGRFVEGSLPFGWCHGWTPQRLSVLTPFTWSQRGHDREQKHPVCSREQSIAKTLNFPPLHRLSHIAAWLLLPPLEELADQLSAFDVYVGQNRRGVAAVVGVSLVVCFIPFFVGAVDRRSRGPLVAAVLSHGPPALL